MQCRICFEDGDETTLVTPCRCRGSSAYIHQTCLDRYIQYYPDRICRVCHEEFPVSASQMDVGLCWILTTCLLATLLVSQVRIIMKLFLFGVGISVCAYLLHRRLLTSTPLVFVSIIAILMIPGGHSMAMTTWLIVLGVITIFYTLARQLPAILLLGLLVTLMLAGYVMFLTMFAYHSLDSPAFTVYLSILYLMWYAWIHDQQPLLRLPT